jgi:hypothetical protein
MCITVCYNDTWSSLAEGYLFKLFLLSFNYSEMNYLSSFNIKIISNPLTPLLQNAQSFSINDLLILQLRPSCYSTHVVCGLIEMCNYVITILLHSSTY